jgi:glyoxylase-like metal-dependent hydrolase (beta-lactamase superfamily II)
MLAKYSKGISRRLMLKTVAIGGAVWTLRGQDIPDTEHIRAEGVTAKITVEPLRRHVAVVMGAGGNIAVLTGHDGKVLVDAGYATAQTHVTQALKNIGSDPIRHLINTHWHFDHTDGNDWLHKAGATIVAHENTLTRLSRRQEIPAFRGIFPPSPPGALPSITFAKEKTLRLNGEDLILEHYPPAHSDSDISVRFVQANILHTGDTWFDGYYPFIDLHNGGSLEGMIQATVRNLNSVDNQTIIVPGHGPKGSKSDLSEYVEMLKTIRDKVAVLKRQGRSLAETIATKPSAAFDGKWGGGWIGPPTFVALVYEAV